MFALPDQALPQLRDDLELILGPKLKSGAQSWTIYDPARNRYFRITDIAFELLRYWNLGDWKRIAATVARTTGRKPGDAERDWMVRFLKANMLVQRSTVDDVRDLDTVRKASKSSWYKQALHHYLFFRIPLLRPQVFLEATLPLARFVTSRAMVMLFAAIACIGFYLAAAQWDTFLATFMQFTTWDGIAWYGAALVFAKIIHELGHAYTAVRYGCRVPTMGVALLVMWPVLYTDTSDAWRLTDKHKRLAIGAAGMTAELALAVLATFLWSFLPDGPARSATFVVATVTWVMTLAVNLNPFMRFDGYYLLSDALEVENLQDRAFAYARWWLRERLFGFDERAPEVFAPVLARTLIAYAITTWVYRFFLFLGIAVLVYAFFFKVLGIFLFAVEIMWFIGLPLFRELKEWWERRAELHLNRNSLMTLLGVFFAVVVLVVPWRGSIAVPAVFQADARAQIYTPVVAQVQAIHVKTGDKVEAGQVLITLEAPDLTFQIAQAERTIEMVRLQVRREVADRNEGENIQVLRHRLVSEITTLRGLQEQQALLSVRAPLSGRVTYLDNALRTGLWVNETQPLAQVVDGSGARFVGYVDEREVVFIRSGAQALFYPDDPSLGAIAARVQEVADVNTQVLDVPYIASVYGGDVSVSADNGGRLIPSHGIYRITLLPDPKIEAPISILRGTLQIEGAPESLIVKVWTRVWSVVMRESGF